MRYAFSPAIQGFLIGTQYYSRSEYDKVTDWRHHISPFWLGSSEDWCENTSAACTFLPDIHRELFFSTIEALADTAYAFATSQKTPMLRPKHKCIPNNIRYYRRRAHLRLYELAHIVGTSSPANLANWEKGRRVPNLDNVLRISAALMVPPEILYLDRLKQLREEIKVRKSRPIKKPL